MAYLYKRCKITFIAIVVFAITFPLLLNLLVTIPTPKGWPIAGNDSDWLVFWATYISAVASFAMVVAAYKTLAESKRQWIIANTAHIIVTTYQDKYHQVFIRICNTSSIGVILQSIQVCNDPSQEVKDLFCIIKSPDNSDNFTKWQRLYSHFYITIRPYEYEDILLLQNFPRRLDDTISFKIKYNNSSTEVKINLADIVITQQ